jgi:hypothetical protein
MEIVFLLQYNLYRKKYEKYDNAKYQMGGDIITQSTEEKDLGITIDEKFKFQIHIHFSERFYCYLPCLYC